MMEDDNDSVIKHYLFVILRNWKWFALSILIALIAAYIVNRYTTPLYSVNATLLIKDKDKNPSAEALKELELFSSSVNIENEIAILQSFSLTKRVVDSLKLYLAIVKTGNIKNTELFGSNKPFQISILSDPETLQHAQIQIAPLGNAQFEISFINAEHSNTEPMVVTWNQRIDHGRLSFMIMANSASPSVMTADEPPYHLIINSPEATVKDLREQINITQKGKESSILQLGMNSANPEKAKAILNLLMTSYIDRELELKNETASRTVEFIDEQLVGIQNALYKTESEMQSFRSDNNIVDISQEGQSIYVKLQELEKESNKVDLQLDYYRYLVDYLQKPNQPGGVVSPSTASIADPGLSSLVNQFNALKAQLIISEANATSVNPQVKTLKVQVQSLIASMIENAENLINTTKLAKNQLKLQITKAEKELNILPSSERELINIQRRFNLNDNLYVYLLEKKAEAGIARASTVASTEILDAPLLIQQTKPKKLKNYFMAFAVGAAIPFLLILIREFFTTSIQEVSEIEKATSYPILSSIALSHKETELVMKDFPKSRTAEGFRNMRAGLKYLSPEQIKCHTIMFTSFTSGDGKTFSAMNTAVMMAQSGYKTILLGLDLRKPKIFDTFGFTNDKGISNLLVDEVEKEKLILNTPIHNLDLIVSGPIPPLPNELFMRESFSKLMTALKAEYDYIIMDTPPLGLVSDAFEISNYADYTLFVIRNQLTPKKALDFLKDIKAKKLIENVGIVYNGVDYKKLTGLYEYGYGYGDKNSYYEE